VVYIFLFELSLGLAKKMKKQGKRGMGKAKRKGKKFNGKIGRMKEKNHKQNKIKKQYQKCFKKI